MIGLMRMLLPLPTLAVALALPLSGVAAQTAPPPLPAIAHQLEQGPSGARYGLLVATLDGAPVLAIAPDERFIPASNTKMFTTATAYADLAALDRAAQGTGVRIEGRDVILEGRGDARLSSAEDCRVDCLQTLADAIAARTRRVRDVIGDDSWYPDERWGPGMSWNNIQSRYGTGISALTLDDNALTASVAPGAIGAPATVRAAGYYRIDNRIVTVPGKAQAMVADRAPNSRLVRLTGTIGVEAAPATLHFSVDDQLKGWSLTRTRETALGPEVSILDVFMTEELGGHLPWVVDEVVLNVPGAELDTIMAATNSKALCHAFRKNRFLPYKTFPFMMWRKEKSADLVTPTVGNNTSDIPLLPYPQPFD